MDAKEIQSLLRDCGYEITVDGQFGPQSIGTLKQFQKDNGLPVTGTWQSGDNNEALLIKVAADKNRNSELLSGVTKLFMDKDEYVGSTSKKIGVCLHHTASGPGGKAVPTMWNNDDRGRVGTHFVIGGDGEIIQCIPLNGWGYHIATTRMGFGTTYNDKVNASYFGVEICNWGYLELKDGKYINYVGGVVPESEVVKLDTPFRGFTYWHKYTDKQVDSTKLLLSKLKAKFGFKYETELEIPHNHQWLDLSWDAMACKRVLTTHTNFEYGKFDCSPQPNFFKMLQTELI
jgi:peptidoglycan hydrolase-like protein with peptidoglycan-binding domain